MRLSFAWWNTSLSPPTPNKKSTLKQKKFVLEVVRYLTSDLHVDFLALGEVTTGDLDYFFNNLNLDEYQIYDGTVKNGRLQFDTGALFRKSAFSLLDSKSLIASRGKHFLKVANRLDLMINETGDPLHIFISHWPSRLFCPQNSADRHTLGFKLREAVQEIDNSYPGPAQIILLGDYNDEPFDSSLAEHLLAVRDRILVRKNPQLLYNPFWRHLGEALPYLHGTSCDSHSGSCFHSSGLETKWRTFDQIIFSAAFIGPSKWHLNETHTQILQFSPFVDSVFPTKDIFDHFPVLSVIEREAHNG
jgi:hypothetical protein